MIVLKAEDVLVCVLLLVRTRSALRRRSPSASGCGGRRECVTRWDDGDLRGREAQAEAAATGSSQRDEEQDQTCRGNQSISTIALAGYGAPLLQEPSIPPASSFSGARFSSLSPSHYSKNKVLKMPTSYYGYMIPRDLIYEFGKSSDPKYTEEDHEGTAMSAHIKKMCWHQTAGKVLQKCRGTGLKSRWVIVIDPEDPSRDWFMIATMFGGPTGDNRESEVPLYPGHPTEEELRPLKELFGSDASLVMSEIRYSYPQSWRVAVRWSSVRASYELAIYIVKSDEADEEKRNMTHAAKTKFEPATTENYNTAEGCTEWINLARCTGMSQTYLYDP
ncbi:hypothetical protein BJ138DRAFT_1184065 [Hygrophoropsis aurantiaca]|uniref:Uncharacterized protein n=1 Tax=Hygrophoropsis aurantiaca TaxID=72124 RepID=A0ACB7ZUW8_9AGAM|nr:hypothetical protein BJ138DRAFT_1184065 [Hygrophoropsis aurantiaca]